MSPGIVRLDSDGMTQQSLRVFVLPVPYPIDQAHGPDDEPPGVNAVRRLA